MIALAALCAGLAVALALAGRPRLSAAAARTPTASTSPGWLRRGRVVWSALAAVAAYTFLGGWFGMAAAPAAAAFVWSTVGRAEPPATRRAREAARRDLPHVVGLLGDALRSGRPPVEALSLSVAALPGPAADRLAVVLPRLRLGLDPGVVWAALAADPDLGPLGRTLARAHESGAPVAAAVQRLALELARTAQADVEDRARAVGVKAAVPLVLCLLPAFVLLGIVPVVAGLLSTLGI